MTAPDRGATYQIALASTGSSTQNAWYPDRRAVRDPQETLRAITVGAGWARRPRRSDDGTASTPPCPRDRHRPTWEAPASTRGVGLEGRARGQPSRRIFFFKIVVRAAMMLAISSWVFWLPRSG